MFQVYFARVVSHGIDTKNSVRFASFLNVKKKIKQLLGKEDIEVPYKHICQIGDPILRGRAMQIEPEVIQMPEFQKVSIKVSIYKQKVCFYHSYNKIIML